MFPDRQVVAEQEMMPVHLGTQQLLVTPSDSKISPFTVTLRVTAPATLGSDPSKSVYDSLIVYNAHLRGIPPQVIKGVIAHESEFDPKAYRYEPVNRDRNDFGTSGAKMGMKAYQPYIIRNPSSLWNSTTIAPRSRYGVILTNGSPVLIPNNYESLERRPLYCYDIVKANNTNAYGFKAQNWDDNFRIRFIRSAELDPGGLLFQGLLRDQNQRIEQEYNFIAQTITASSYGLMQVMYYVAVEDYGFVVAGAGIDPTHESFGLFNPSVNIYLGTLHVYMNYIGGSTDLARSSVNSLEKMEVLLRRGLQKYNGLKKPQQKSDEVVLQKEYNQTVWGKVKHYYPAPASTVFN